MPQCDSRGDVTSFGTAEPPAAQVIGAAGRDRAVYVSRETFPLRPELKTGLPPLHLT